MSNHTPGPWRVAPFSSEAHIVNGMADTICAIKVGRSDESEKAAELKANACLISAAPDLLEQLEKLVGIICSMPGFEERDVNIEDCDEAKAVIAKAKG